MKKVFIVRGSEDGNVGVYSNKKLAFAAALTYAQGGENGDLETYMTGDAYRRITPSYQAFCKQFKHRFSAVSIYGERYGTNAVCAETECFILNR